MRVPVTDSMVDLKVTANDGKLQVSVRSADPELAHSIQSGIGDLVGQLEKKGFETETWLPAERSVAAAAPTAEPSSPHSGSGNSQQQSGRGAQQQGDGRQHSQGQGQGQKPKWLDEMEFGFSLDTSSGANVQ